MAQLLGIDVAIFYKIYEFDMKLKVELGLKGLTRTV
jgi:hypothetical protein